MRPEVISLGARQKSGSGGIVALGIGVAVIAGLVLVGRGSGGGQESTPAGGIATVTLSQSPRRRFLGNDPRHFSLAQDINKSSADTIRVSYFASFSTKNAQGQAITWRYRVQTRLLDETRGQQIGITNFFEGNFPNGGVNRHDTHVIPIATPAGTLISGFAEVLAAKSDSAGNPTSQWVVVATGPASNRVRIV